MKNSFLYKWITVLACFSLAFVVSGYSQEKTSEPKAPSKAALKKYDADKDGKLSDEEKAKGKAEAKEKSEKAKKEALAKYDANANGKLDPEEKEKMKAEQMAEKEARKAQHEARKMEKNAKHEAKEAAK
jgi:hypothetical protein